MNFMTDYRDRWDRWRFAQQSFTSSSVHF